MHGSWEHLSTLPMCSSPDCGPCSRTYSEVSKTPICWLVLFLPSRMNAPYFCLLKSYSVFEIQQKQLSSTSLTSTPYAENHFSPAGIMCLFGCSQWEQFTSSLKAEAEPHSSHIPYRTQPRILQVMVKPNVCRTKFGNWALGLDEVSGYFRP